MRKLENPLSFTPPTVLSVPVIKDQKRNILRIVNFGSLMGFFNKEDYIKNEKSYNTGIPCQ
jgi:hypothetical protein